MLSPKQLQNICLLWNAVNRSRANHKMCRYLYQDDVDHRKWYCSKLHPSKKDKVDAAVIDYTKDCKKRGVDPKSQLVPLGDNCSGFPILKHILQGEE